MNDLVSGAEGQRRIGKIETSPLAWVWSQYRGETRSEEGESQNAAHLGPVVS